MWFTDNAHQKVFRAGREAWGVAAEQARTCPCFRADDEDEQCAEEELSCYNCRYRRWTPDSFTCQAS